jgi:hypothetical protein
MATANHSTESNSVLPGPTWPNEPEELLQFVPEDISGTPLEMLLNVLIRTHGVVALLCSEFMGNGDFRPTDQEIGGALWTAQSQLELARELLERLDTVEVTHDNGQEELFTEEEQETPTDV